MVMSKKLDMQQEIHKLSAEFATKLIDLVYRQATIDLMERLQIAVPKPLEGGGGVPVLVAREAPKDKRGTFSKIRPCIAKGCQNLSKGPRFHYLCADHIGAGKRQIAKWREEHAAQ